MLALRKAAVVWMLVFACDAADLRGAECDKTCDGKWEITTFVKKGTPFEAPGGGPKVEVLEDGAGRKLGRREAKISGESGTWSAYAQAESLKHGLGVFFLTVDTTALSALGQKEKKVTKWLAGTGVAPCNHTAPQDAKVSVQGTGQASVTVKGDARNPALYPQKGKVVVKGIAEVKFLSNLAFPASSKPDVKVETDLTYNEQPALGIKIGSIKISASNGIPIPEVEITIDPTVDNIFEKSSGAQTATCTALSAATDISGHNIIGVGAVTVQALVDNGANLGYAKATTSIDVLTLSVDNGGTFDGCCNGQKPKHDGHGTKEVGPTDYPAP